MVVPVGRRWELCKLIVENIVIGERHRALNADKIESLANSMKAIGLQHPISVWVDDDQAESVMKTLVEHSRTGRMGDGKVFCFHAHAIKE